MYQAFEAPPAKRARLAREAIEISPDCADAYVLLAEDAESAAAALPLYEQGVAAGERALGKKAFKQDKGHFWGVLETRPYMRRSKERRSASGKRDDKKRPPNALDRC